MKREILKRDVSSDFLKEVPEPASLSHDYAAKLGATIFSLLTGFATAGLVPRLLGAEQFGIFNYVTHFFNQISGFLQVGSGNWFFQRLSKDPEDDQAKRFFLTLTSILWGALIAFVAITVASNGSRYLWPEVQNKYVWLGLGVAVTVWWAGVLVQVSDAIGLTIKSELTRVIYKTVGVIGLVCLAWLGWSKLSVYFVYLCLVNSFWIGLLWYNLQTRRRNPTDTQSGNKKLSSTGRECWEYSHPLIAVSVLTLFVNVGERWLLQSIGGSIEQGFLGLGLQIAAIIFMFTAPLTPLFTRELALAHKDGREVEMRNCFTRMLPLVVAATAALSLFACVNAEDMTAFFGGAEFAKAEVVVGLLAIYPIYQAYGQLCGGFYYATGRTRLYRNVGIVNVALGILILYFLMAPKSMCGLNLGAEGLALKIVILAFFSANLHLVLISRCLDLGYVRKFLVPQIVVVVLFGFFAELAKLSGNSVSHLIPRLLLNGFVYGTLLCVAVWSFPSLLGRTRVELKSTFSDTIRILRIRIRRGGN